MVAKRYVRELASDFRKWYEAKCKEHPYILPAGFLRQVNKAEMMCAGGLVTSRETCEKILDLWRKCEEWVSEKEEKGENGIML